MKTTDTERSQMATIHSICRITPTRQTTTALALGGIDITTGHAGGIAAEVGVEELTLHVTQLEGETGWTIDAMFRGSFPIFANGEGARYTMLREIADPAVIAQLDAAAAGL